MFYNFYVFEFKGISKNAIEIRTVIVHIGPA